MIPRNSPNFHVWQFIGGIRWNQRNSIEEDHVLQALVPVWKQVGASDVPSSAEGFRQKFGLDIEIKRKLKT